MDFNLKQWREQQQQHESEQEQEQQTPSAKLPRLLLLDTQHHQQPPSDSSSALPLFVTEPTTNTKLNSSSSSNNLSAYPPPHHPDSSTTKFSRGMGGSSSSNYFSLGQWQELELQALIYRHMLAGASVPPELLHLVKKSLFNSSSSAHHHPYNYLTHHPLHHHYPHFQSAAALMQTGYWGRGGMDPEPGRCRRTDGKKWRCSRDVVAGQKYCERHMHRGRNRSRKPVEIPTPTTTTTTSAAASGGNAGGGAGMLKSSNINYNAANQSLAAMIGHGHGHGGGGNHNFAFSGHSPSIDLLQLSQRSSESMVETENDVSGNEKSSGQILRHFFDDWPRSLQQESENGGSSGRGSVTSTTNNLSISDFSLKLSTGDDHHQVGSVERARGGGGHTNWSSSWGTNQVASMGGPLAEALRSSTSNSSPTSVLHQLPKASASEASYIST